VGRIKGKLKIILLKINGIEEKMMEIMLGQINCFRFVEALSFKFLPTV